MCAGRVVFRFRASKTFRRAAGTFSWNRDWVGSKPFSNSVRNRSTNRKWACRPTLLLTGLAIVALISSAPAQAQGASMQNLVGTEWLLEDLGGSGVIDNAQATLTFPKRGEISGMGSCNHFFGSVRIKGHRIHIGKMGATMMQCADAVSDQEGRYISALAAADRISRHDVNLFVHSKELKKPLRFTKLQKSKRMR
jgi:heat shock protein HslJ